MLYADLMLSVKKNIQYNGIGDTTEGGISNLSDKKALQLYGFFD